MPKVQKIAKAVLLNEFVLFLPVALMFYIACTYVIPFIVLYPILLTIYICYSCKPSFENALKFSAPNFLKHFTLVDLRYFSKLLLLFTIPMLLISNTIIFNHAEYDVIKLAVIDNSDFIGFSRDFLPFDSLMLAYVAQKYGNEYADLIVFIFSYTFFVSLLTALLALVPAYCHFRVSWAKREGGFYRISNKEFISILGLVIFWNVVIGLFYGFTNLFNFGAIDSETFINNITVTQLTQPVDLSDIATSFSKNNIFNKIVFLSIVPLFFSFAMGVKIGTSQKRSEINKKS